MSAAEWAFTVGGGSRSPPPATRPSRPTACARGRRRPGPVGDAVSRRLRRPPARGEYGSVLRVAAAGRLPLRRRRGNRVRGRGCRGGRRGGRRARRRRRPAVVLAAGARVLVRGGGRLPRHTVRARAGLRGVRRRRGGGRRGRRPAREHCRSAVGWRLAGLRHRVRGGRHVRPGQQKRGGRRGRRARES